MVHVRYIGSSPSFDRKHSVNVLQTFGTKNIFLQHTGTDYLPIIVATVRFCALIGIIKQLTLMLHINRLFHRVGTGAGRT